MATPIRGRTRPLPIKAGLMETQKLSANINASIHNRFDVEVIDTRTGKIRQMAHGENVICAALWTRMFTPAAWNTYIHYGTGSGTPASTDTSLFAFLGYGTPTNVDDTYTQSVLTSIVSLRRKIQLSESTAVGSTITEVGIGYGTAAATLCTHSMLKDANGNQISISKTSTDIINIYATVYLHWPSLTTLLPMGISKPILAQVIGDTVYEDMEYDTLTRLLLGLYPGSTSDGAVFSKGLFSDNTYNSALTQSLSNSNKTIIYAMTRAGVNTGNVTNGILGITLGQAVSPQCSYLQLSTIGNWFSAPTIMGEAIGTGNGSTKDFSTGFEVVSGTPTVYVDGVTTGDVTIDSGKPKNISDMGLYFILLSRTAKNTLPQSMKGNSSSNGSAIWYNPFYSQGISSFTAGSNCQVEVSDDLSTWVTLCSSGSGGAISVASDYQTYKYWRITGTNSTSNTSNCASAAQNATYSTSANIHFATPPATGAAITMDYTPKCIAKDANHVFDLSVTIALGEYT